MRGVNIGNWLVLERWMGDSPLTRQNVPDDRALIDHVEREPRFSMLEEHYRTFVTLEDFRWMAASGCDLVRIPVPYHLFGSPSHPPCITHLDDALGWAAACGMGVLVDLHTVPLGHNGFDNGGYEGLCAWHLEPCRIDYVTDVLRRIAERYAGHPALWGIEPLNEPASAPVLRQTMRRHASSYPERVARSRVMSYRALKGFYERFYHVVRPIVGPAVRLVFHDRFELWRWDRLLSYARDDNVWLDTHLYLNFADAHFRRRDLTEYLGCVRRFAHRVRRASRHHPVLVGEWSLATHSDLVGSLTREQRRAWYRALATSQLEAWEEGEGGVFWSYRVEGEKRRAWSFRRCVEEGWLDYSQN